jgi:hypothetical protein
MKRTTTLRVDDNFAKTMRDLQKENGVVSIVVLSADLSQFFRSNRKELKKFLGEE